MKIYNAKNQILGRMSSVIAKALLDGETIAIVNAEKAVVSGTPKATIDHYAIRVKRGDPHKGPFYPRTPDGILRRSVRGMLPIKKPKGKEAFKRLKVYTGIPAQFRDMQEKFQTVKDADANRLRTRSLPLGELSEALGSKKRWE